jgi:hypothetical protein
MNLRVAKKVIDDGHVCANPIQAVLDSQFELCPGKREWSTSGACCSGRGCPVCCQAFVVTVPTWGRKRAA